MDARFLGPTALKKNRLSVHLIRVLAIKKETLELFILRFLLR